MNKDVDYIIKILNDNGYEAYIVGGCVRDMILKRTPKDYDITTSALPNEIKACFDKTIDTGIQHGTVTVVLNKNNYEVTTYRIDGEYEDNRHPTTVTFTRNLKDDLLRRDFTMNAIAYHKQIGYVDYFGGQEDIKKGLIKGVGDPDKRFKEDALRMMRALRFSAQLGFEIEKETFEKILENHKLMKNISVERIREELLKLIMSPYIEKFNLLVKTSIFKEVSKKTHDYLKLYEDKIIRVLKFSKLDIFERTAILFSFDNITDELLKFYKFDNKTMKNIKALKNYIFLELKNNDYEIRKTINVLGIELFYSMISIKKAFYKAENKDIDSLNEIYNKSVKIVNRGDCLFVKDLDINGNDLIKNGVEKGKNIGVTLEYLLEQVLKNPNLNNKKSLINLISNNEYC